MNKQQFDKLYLGKAVHPESQEAANEFLELAREFGYRRDDNPYGKHKEETCFRIHDSAVDCFELDFYKTFNYEIVEFKSRRITEEQFKNNFVGRNIYCTTDKDREELLDLADSFGYKWNIGKPLLKSGTCWDVFKENTVYYPIYCYIKHYSLTYGNLERAKENNLEIVEFKSMKPSLKDIILQELGVEIDEEFYPNIIGSPKCRINKNLVVEYLENNLWITSSITLQDLILGGIKIVKLPKPSLTNEEKEFLNNFEFVELEKENNNGLILYIDQCNYHAIDIEHCKHKFNGLQKGKHYTLKELGL